MKKSRILYVLLSFFLVLITLTIGILAANSETLGGDANGDGVVDSKDLIVVRKYLANLNYYTGVSSVEISSNADMNNDGNVRLYDLDLLRYYIVNKNFDGDTENNETEESTETETVTTPVHYHTYSVVITNGEYSNACACGDVKKNYGVSANIEGYLPAEKLVESNNEVVGDIDLTLKSEGGESFVRMDNMKLNASGWMGINLLSGQSINSGRYMAIKLRIGENGNNSQHITFYGGTVGTLESEGQNISIKVSEDNQWHYIIIDAEKCIGDPNTYFVQNGDGSYTWRFLQLRPLVGSQGILNSDKWEPQFDPSDYMDIAYIAFFDQLSEVGEVVSAERYEWSVDRNSSIERYTKDNTCVVHPESYFATENTNGNKAEINCLLCGKAVKSISVSDSVNWYSTLGNMDCYNAELSNLQIENGSLIPYNRFTGTSDGHLNLTGGSGAGTWTAEKYATGYYIAIKYRAVGGSFTFNVSTKNNGEEAYQPGRPLYKDVGVIVGDTTMGQWKVALVKIPEGKNYTVGSTQEIYFMLLTSGAYTIDVAYVAVLDTIDEISYLLEDGESYYYYGSSFSNKGILDGNDEDFEKMTNIHKLEAGKSYIAHGEELFAFQCSDINYYIIQGGYFDGTHYHVAAIRKLDGNYENARILIIDKTGKIVRESDVLALDHANNVTYNPNLGKLVVTHCQSPDGHYYRYSLVDPNTLQITYTADLEKPFFAMAYSPELDKYASGEWSGETIDIWNGNMELEKSVSVETPGSLSQGVFCDAQGIYFVRSSQSGYPSEIRIYDWNANLVRTIEVSLPDNVEPECINIVGNEVFVVGTNWNTGYGTAYRLTFEEIG